MTNNTTKSDSLQPATEMAVDLFDNWFDPIETEVRARSRQFIEELLRGELDAALAAALIPIIIPEVGLCAKPRRGRIVFRDAIF